MVLPEHLTIEYIYRIAVVFCRVGSMLMVLPGLGEVYVTSRAKILFAIILSIVICPVVISYIPSLPKNGIELSMILLIELLIGIFLGLIVRLLFSALHIAGMIITTQSGLGMAIMFDYNQDAQGAVFGTFLGSIAVVLIFLTNMHHLFIEAIVDSYQLFPYGKHMVEDMMGAVIKTVATSFEIGIKISAPYIIVGLLILISSGVLSRLMPAVQIFFLITPVQLLISFFLFIITLSASILWYFDYIYNILSGFMIK